MDWYLLTKFLHVACAVAWLGGGVALVLLGIRADRARRDDDLLTVIRMVTVIAPRVFVPGSVLVLVTGLLMVWLGDLGWQAWIVIGLAGVFVTAGLGMFLLGPLSDEVGRLAATADGRPAALHAGRKLLRLAKVDYVLQFTIVFAMVAKPSWDEVGTLAGMAIVAAAVGAALLLSPAHRSRGA